MGLRYRSPVEDDGVRQAVGVAWQLRRIGACLVRVEPGDVYFFPANDVAVGIGFKVAAACDELREVVAQNIRDLDTLICTRSGRRLIADDLWRVQQIGLAMRRLVCHPLWKDSEAARGTRVDEQPGVMKRVYMHPFNGSETTAALEVRLHLFINPAETYIHNHRSSFASYCIGGDYIHRTWIADTA